MTQPTLADLQHQVTSLQFAIQQEIINRSKLEALLKDLSLNVAGLREFCNDANIQITKLTIKVGGVEGISYTLTTDDQNPLAQTIN